MNKLILLLFLLIIGRSLSAQTVQPIKWIVLKRGEAAKAEHIKNKKTSNSKYDVENFSAELSHTIHLINGSVVEASSDIILDPEKGKYHLYFFDHNEGLTKVYPEDTKFITHSNPYDKKRTITGYPKNDRWLFSINTGKINTFAYSCTTKQIDLYSIGNGEVRAFEDMMELINVLKDNEQSYALLRKKEYYKAIEVYNNHIK